MHRHRAGGAGGGGGHNNTRGRRGAEPFLVYDDPTFAVSSSTFIPSLADRVPVPAGEQRWLRYDSRGKASYVDTSDATKNKHAVSVLGLVVVVVFFFFFLFSSRVFSESCLP